MPSQSLRGRCMRSMHREVGLRSGEYGGKNRNHARRALSDAAARGLNEGDEAKLTNDTGEIVLKVRLSDEIPVGVALAHKGRWPKRETNQANVNFLNPGKKTDMGESSSVHGVEVFIRAATDTGE